MNWHVAIAGVKIVCASKGAMFTYRAEYKFCSFNFMQVKGLKLVCHDKQNGCQRFVLQQSIIEIW